MTLTNNLKSGPRLFLHVCQLSVLKCMWCLRWHSGELTHLLNLKRANVWRKIWLIGRPFSHFTLLTSNNHFWSNNFFQLNRCESFQRFGHLPVSSYVIFKNVTGMLIITTICCHCSYNIKTKIYRSLHTYVVDRRIVIIITYPCPIHEKCSGRKISRKVMSTNLNLVLQRTNLSPTFRSVPCSRPSFESRIITYVGKRRKIYSMWVKNLCLYL